MRRHRTYIRRTKRGGVVKVVAEHYLRNDIWCGSKLCEDCQHEPGQAILPDKGKGGTPVYLVLDTNILLHQADVISDPAFDTHCILPQTAMEEARHRSIPIYKRMYELMGHGEGEWKGATKRKLWYVFSNEHHTLTYIERESKESPNDRNDRAIRVAALWYKAHLEDNADIVLLSDDRENRRRATKEGLTAMSMAEYLKKRIPDGAAKDRLTDLLAVPGDGCDDGGDSGLDIGGKAGQGRVKERRLGPGSAASFMYEEHLPVSKAESLIKAGDLFKGTFKVNRNYWKEASVLASGSSFKTPILIKGLEDMNRAIDGDLVAVALHRKEKWGGSREVLLPVGEMGAEEIDETEAAVTKEREEEEEEEEEGTNAKKTSNKKKMKKKGEEEEKAARKRRKIGQKEKAEKGKKKGEMEVEEQEEEGEEDVKAIPTGRVVAILRRKTRAYCGSIELNARSQSLNQGRVNFIAVDRRIPKISFVSRQVQALLDKRIVVQFDSWPRNSRRPNGHYVKTLGPIGDLDTETIVVLMEHDIPTAAWSPAVLQCLPPEDWKVTAEEAGRRTDLRESAETCIVSVDPPGCTDIDDALHCRVLPNGNYECGVHIADVTHYVREGSALDNEALNRATSVYLVQKRIDMIPSMLSTDLCSLRSKVDRLAFSVFWEITPEFEIVDTKFAKTVIRSRAALAYGDAQKLLDDPDAKDDVAIGLKRLNAVAKVLRQRRMDAGALTLASPQIKFVLDSESQKPQDAEMYQLKEANGMVEEFMLLANISVAKRILRSFPSFSILRRHPKPAEAQFDLLVRAARVVGLELDVHSNKKLQESLDKAVIEGFPYFNTLIRVLATRCMTQAVYFSSGSTGTEEFYHYGLAAPIYTHFTSPIRRYSDILVHRLLAAALGIDPVPTNLESEEKSRDMCAHMNHRNRMAQQVGRSSAALYTLIFFRERDVIENAIVLSVRKNGIRVFVPKYGIEGSIALEKGGGGESEAANARDTKQLQRKSGSGEEDNGWKFDPDTLSISNPALPGSPRYQIFQRLKVRVYVKTSEMRREWLEMELVNDEAKENSSNAESSLANASAERTGTDSRKSTGNANKRNSATKRKKKRGSKRKPT